MKKTFGILLSILLSLSLAAPNAAFAGDDEPKKTPAERAKELQDKINSSAKDRAWTGLKEDIFEVPKPGKLLESAANQLLESMPDLIKDMDAMRNMTPEQKLQYIKTTLIDRIKEKSVDQVKDTVKEYIKKYAEQKVREYLFKEQIGTLVHQCIVGGQSVSSAWAGVDTVVKSQLDTGMRAFKFGMKGTEIGWDVLWVWKEKGGGPAMLKLEEKVLGEVAKYFIPGWGYYKIALSVSDALREYVLHYAFDSAYEEKLKIILPCPPQSKGFAAWILATDIPSYVNREWDEQIGYTGAYQKYFETTKPGEEQKEEFGQAMKTKLIDYLQAVKADIQKKQDIQHEVEAKVKELEKQSDEADAAVKSAISTGMSEAQKYLQMVSDFNNKFFGLAKQDVKEAIANKEKEFDQAAAGAAKEDGIKYTPIDRHTIVSALEAAGSEMTESGAQGWDVNAIRSSYETYLEIQKKEIEKVQRDVGEKTAQAQKMLEQTQKSFAPQFEALNKAHEAATTADERNRIEGQIAAVQNSYGAAIRPYSSVARDLTAQFAKDQELLVAEEGAVLMDIAERARTRNAALAVGMQVLREEIGPAAQAYQEAMIQLRADIQKLNYPDCWRGIKYVTLVGDAGQNQRRLPGDFIQSMKDLEGIKEAVEEDDRAAVNLHKREKDAFDWYSITAQNVRGAYLSLVPASLQSIGRSRDETKTSEDISGFYGVPSVSTFINRTGSQTISPQAIEIYAAGIRETMEQSRAEIMQPPVDTQAALQKINAEMSKLKPLVSADEDAQIFLRISSVLSGDSYMFDCVRFPIEREAGRAETLFTRKDGVVYPKVDPEETEGAAYLKAMKESWERNKDRVQALRDLKKKIVGVIVYTGLNESMEKTFQRDI
ncbi:MAG: hypothetical protein HZC17_04680, partial [Candidatus Omnitrophica bacterium]|nr:hypothetical protein [Candidatus Omnitrophota bacterium]